MSNEFIKLGPFAGGLHNIPGGGEQIEDDEAYVLQNLEVDHDGSLANRPEIALYPIVYGDTSQLQHMVFLGTWITATGTKYIVFNSLVTNTFGVINAATGVMNGIAFKKVSAVVQYADKLWAVTPQSSTSGGYFSIVSNNVTWTDVTSMPRGDAIIIYKERAWIAAGISSTSNTSRFFFSAVADPTSWGGTDFYDVVPGNGEKLVSIVQIGTDVVLLKEHSTWRFTYSVDPRKATIDMVDDNIGIPTAECVAVYNNSLLYVQHDNSIYEMYQYTYDRISENIDMIQKTDLDMYADSQFGISTYRDRLFVRYYSRLYVYTLDLKVWSEWVSDRKFSRVVSFPSDLTGQGTAYTASVSVLNNKEAYSFSDHRRVQFDGKTTNVPATIPSSNGFTSTYGQMVNTISVAVPPAATTNDWIYLVYTGRCTTGIGGPYRVCTPSDPKFQTVVPFNRQGQAGSGSEIQIWRKRWEASEGNYRVNFSTNNTIGEVTAVVVRGGSNALTLKNFSVLNTWAGVGVGSASPLPIECDPGSLILTCQINVFPNAAQRTFNFGGSTLLSSVFDTGSVSSFNDIQLISQRTASPTSNVIPVRITDTTVSWLPTHSSYISIVNVIIPPLVVPANTAAEQFKAYFTTKTFDFAIPYAFKVLFWFGLDIATSGKISAYPTLPNTYTNLTWGAARKLYKTWGAAKAAHVKWGSSIQDDAQSVNVLPVFGAFSRKFIKLKKKLRFRQMYFSFVFDVITNGGVADSCLRVYDMAVFIKPKETVVKETT